MSEDRKLERTHGTKQNPEPKDSEVGRFRTRVKRTCTDPFLRVRDGRAHCPSVLVHSGPRTLTGHQEPRCKYEYFCNLYLSRVLVFLLYLNFGKCPGCCVRRWRSGMGGDAGPNIPNTVAVVALFLWLAGMLTE